MADESRKLTGGPEKAQKIVRAVVAADGTVTVPCCEAELVSVDVADVDLLLGFGDGTYVIIPNGALDALGDTPRTVEFVDNAGNPFDIAHFGNSNRATLGDLFKMVGTTELVKAGSLRIKSEKLDDESKGVESDGPADEPIPPPDRVVQQNNSGKGPGSEPILTTPRLLDQISDEPSGPIIEPRPSVFKPGQKVASVEPVVRIDPNITPDDFINIAEADPASMVTVTGSAAGSVIIGDSVTITVGSYSVATTIQADMTFSVAVPGQHFVDSAYPDRVDALLVSYEGKTATATETYQVDLDAPQPTIGLDPVIAGDNVVNIQESGGIVTVTGDVSELTGFPDNAIAGAQVTLTLDGSATPYTGYVDASGQRFSINVPGSALVPVANFEGAGAVVGARIDVVDTHGNPAFSLDTGFTVGIDTLAPSAAIAISSIAGDGTVTFAEALPGNMVAVTGTITGDEAGNSVTLTINNKTYTGSAVGGAFSINVLGSDLVADADSAVEAVVETFDAAGNSTVSAPTVTAYAVDSTLPLPQISLDPITGDNLVNQAEAGAVSVAITGRVAGDAQVGDQVTLFVNGSPEAFGYVNSDYTFSINVAGNVLDIGDGNTGNIVAEVVTAGTSGAASAQTPPVTYTVDLTPPSPSIALNDIAGDNTVNIAESGADVVVTGTVVGGQTGDNVTLTVGGNDYAGLVRADGTFSINVLGSDLVSDADRVIDASITSFDVAGNPGTVPGAKSYGVDIVRPSATIAIDDLALNVGDDALVTITFNEPVVDFDNSDLTVENGTLSPVTTADGGMTWTATLTPDAPLEDPTNVISLNNAGVIDLYGNTGAGTSVSANYSIDTAPPTVGGVTVDDALLTDSDNGGSLNVTVAFSEVMDTSVDPTLQFDVDTTGSLLFSGGAWDATGTVYTATYDVLDGGVDHDAVSIDVINARDINGNVQEDYAAEVEFEIDTLNPAVVILDDNTDGVVSYSDILVNYTLNFSEEISAISAADLVINGGTLTSGPVLSADGRTATFSVTAFDKSTADLEVSVGGTIVDLNGNALVPSTSILPVDTLNPRVTISGDNADGVVSDNDIVVNYTLTFSAEVVSVTAADLTISGGILTGGPVFAADGLSATFEVTAYDNSTSDLVVTVNDTIVDLGGRPLVPSTSTLAVDTVNPSVIIAEDNTDGVVSPGDEVVNYTLNFSKEVAAVNAADLTIDGGTLNGAPVLTADGLSATFSVTADDDSSAPLVVTVNDTVLDVNGNALIPSSNTLPVDTKDPTATVSGYDTVVSEADTSIAVVVNFSEKMDLGVIPTLTFTPDVSSSLSKNFEGWFNEGRKLVVIYNVLDANLDLSGVTADLAGGQDLHGNLLQDHNAIITFDIDTVNPLVTITHDNLDGIVSDEDSAVNFTLAFSEEVAAISASDLSIAGGSLSSGPVLAADRLSATFSVTVPDSSTSDLVVTVNNTVTDVNGNRLVPASETLTVDTLNDLPHFKATLYTSSEFKVTGGAGVPAGSTDPSPAGQATRERIDGTATADSIVHNPAFSSAPSKWSKTLHLDFKVFTELTSIVLVADPAIAGVPGFSIVGNGVVWDGLYTWTITPDAAMSADMILNGLDLDIVYDVADAGGPIDFDLTVDVTGMDGAVAHNFSEPLDFSWRDARTEAEFDVTEGGDQVMVLPRDGLGVDIYAGDGDDNVAAGAGDDTVYGDAGNDTVDGGAGNDLLYGGSGQDTLSGSAGDDTIYGDAGNDSLDGGIGMDHLWGGGDDDTLSGGSGDDYLYGEAGNDILSGGDGADFLSGGAGADSIDGGAGSDTVSFAGSSAGVVASLATGTGSAGDAAGDTYVNVENLTGGDGNDTLVGNGTDNVLDGGAGDDLLIGGASLTGDTLIGGAGSDTVSYAASVGAVTASLAAGSGSAGDAAGDTYSGIENLTGGAGADTLIGDGNDNVLTGGGGGDALVGGGGIDTASYAGATSRVIAALDPGLADFQEGDAFGDTFSQIENLLGSDHDDILFGNSGDNVLDGGLGDDALNAGAGDDTIFALQGSDTVRGDIGNDRIHVSADAASSPNLVDGGDGSDTLLLDGLAAVGGTYDFTDLAGLDGRLEGLEVLDIREGADGRADASTNIQITGQDVLNMVDFGAELTVLADSGDTLDLSAFAGAGETYVENTIAPDHTEYIISDGGGELARIQWHTA